MHGVSQTQLGVGRRRFQKPSILSLDPAGPATKVPLGPLGVEKKNQVVDRLTLTKWFLLENRSHLGDLEHHFQVCVGEYIINIWVM